MEPSLRRRAAEGTIQALASPARIFVGGARWHKRTLVRDAIEYEVGFGSLGTLAISLFIERQLRYIFAHRQEILPKLLM
jgi:hypothetical protein